MQKTDSPYSEKLMDVSTLVRKPIVKTQKLADVCYEIRGPVMREALRLEQEGHRVLKLNIGNPAAFGFDAPDELIQDVIHHLPQSSGYVESKGIYSARKAVMQECQRIGIPNVEVSDVYIGNGVSELIAMAVQGLLNEGDEVLLPAPDYPLWTAAIRLAGGVPVHYRCDEGADWTPDLQDIKRKTTRRTRAIAVINPNNPTGAVYERNLLEDIAQHARETEIVVFADEIYSKVLYDDARHVPMGSIDEDILVLTFDGLSKSYRAAGFRTGWLIVSGAVDRARDYIEGLDILASMRLCANVPTQHAVQTALGGYQSIHELTRPGGDLCEQRDLAYRMLDDIDGVSCTKPKGALYAFPKIDTAKFNIVDDEKFVLDLLLRKKILVVHGSGFNYPTPDHFRVVFLPRLPELGRAITDIGSFLETYKQT